MSKKCNCCGKELDLTQLREDGLPVGVSFVKCEIEVTLCADCLINIGKDKQK